MSGTASIGCQPSSFNQQSSVLCRKSDRQLLNMCGHAFVCSSAAVQLAASLGPDELARYKATRAAAAAAAKLPLAHTKGGRLKSSVRIAIEDDKLALHMLHSAAGACSNRSRLPGLQAVCCLTSICNMTRSLLHMAVCTPSSAAQQPAELAQPSKRAATATCQVDCPGRPDFLCDILILRVGCRRFVPLRSTLTSMVCWVCLMRL